MKQEEIKLRKKVRRKDVEALAEWLEDEKVSEYLNEEQDISDDLKKLSNRSTLPLFTHAFNQDGQFFMISLRQNGPIGFLRLVPKGEGTEMVVVIGEQSEWGNGYGYAAIQKGLKKAFYQWREEKVLAKIDPDNTRSKAVFRKAGFSKEEDLEHDELFSVSFDEFVSN
jgi:RimJ/RimL family protein N-acetyltransferase